MSRVISNLLLSLSMIPMAIGVFFVTAITLDESARMNDEEAFAIASLVLLVFVLVYWTCVWATSLTWNRSCVYRTATAAVCALGVGLVVGWIVASVVRHDATEAAMIFGSIAASTAYMIFTVIFWRETASEQAERLSKTAGAAGGVAGILLCPACGYNMKGLTQARCPECGTEYTLDSLLAANIERTEPERELGTGSA